MKKYPRIIPDETTLDQVLTTYREQGKKIVLTQGSFDMIHIGHGRYLEKAKKSGNILIVGVDSDEKIRARKGPDRPVVPQEERMEMLTHLRSVDHVIIKEINSGKWHLIKLVKPDILIATEETYTPEQIEQLKRWCGQVMVLKSQATTSTSAKLRRLQIGFFQTFSDKLTDKVHLAIDDVIRELQRS